MKTTLTEYVAGAQFYGLQRLRHTAEAIATLLTQVTTATGQIDWSHSLLQTTYVNAGSNGVIGYEIYRFDDSLQASYPVFIKLEYGTGENTYDSNTGSGFQIWMTVGKGQDDAGGITGVLIPRTSVFKQFLYDVTYNQDTDSTEQGQIYLSNMDGSALTVNIFPASMTVSYSDSYFRGGYFALERSRDAGGNPTGDGLFLQYSYMHRSSIMGTSVAKAVSYSTGTLNTRVGGGIAGISFNLSSNVSIAMGSTVPIFSGLAVPGDGVYWAPRCCLATSIANLGGGQLVAGLLESRDYISAGKSGCYADIAGQQYAVAAVAWY